eukprot:1724004-Rhodomonas_salina.1
MLASDAPQRQSVGQAPASRLPVRAVAHCTGQQQEIQRRHWAPEEAVPGLLAVQAAHTVHGAHFNELH